MNDDNDIILPDGTRVPRSLVSPGVLAEAYPAPTQEKVDEGSALLSNIATTGKEAMVDSYKAMFNPLATGKTALEGVGMLAEKAASLGNDTRKALGLPMATLSDIRNMATQGGNPLGKSTYPPAETPPAPGSPSTLPAMALQAAMGAGGAPADSVTLKASPGVRVGMGSYADERKDAEAAAKSEQGAAAKLGDIAAQRAAVVAGEQEGRARQMEQEEMRRAAIEERAQSISQQQIQKAETLQNELRNLSQTKIDPNHFWANKTTGDRMAAAFGVFLGGLGGGPNQAIGILNQAIDRDIDAQKTNWENARQLKAQEIEGQKNIYGMHMAALGDQRAAEAGARASALEMFNQRLEAAKSQFDSPEIKAKAEAAQAAIQKQLAETKINLQKAVNEDAYKRGSLEIQSAELGLRAQANAIAAQAAQAKQKGLYVPGVGLALDEESKKKVQEAAGAYNSAKSALDQMRELRKEAGGGELLDRGLVKRMQAAQAEYVGAANQMKKFGALDKGTQELLGQLTGGDITDFGSGVDEALAQGAASLDRTFQGQTRPYMAQYEEAAKPVTTFTARK